MWRWVSVVGLGWLFAIGLGISGMTDVDKVLAFLDLGGAWDPSLMGVMGGAIAVYAIGFAWVRRRLGHPIFADQFHLPTRRELDARLLGGAALFGAGWGISGICPGPGLTSIVGGAQTSVAFVAAMIVGMFVVQTVQRVLGSRREAPALT